jgi:hypothetical protein
VFDCCVPITWKIDIKMSHLNISAVVEQSDYYIYHQCYYEGGYCSLKNITCQNDTVIDIIWSRIGYSKNWQWDGTRTNCSVTDETCYKEIDEPERKCSGLTVCSLDTCSNNTYQVIDCTFPHATNYLQINYTCVEGKIIMFVSSTLMMLVVRRVHIREILIAS